MKMFKKWFAAFFLMLLSVSNHVFAQAGDMAQEVEMADSLRQDGKIYIVVVVLLTVLTGLIAYLIVLDRKVGRLEKQVKH